eukprot:GHVR01012023.1.p1 GENE.GHVR01012023.1~~GHVR01012023.1.p1  ORF type:complete len:317 (-),score=79.69 GHVR01012023.1:535-1485(-)
MSEKTLKRKHSDTKEQHIASVLKDYTPENGSELAIRWFVEDDADDEGDIVSRWSVWWPCTLRSLPLEGVTEGCSGSPELVESPHWANTSVSVVEKSEELSIEELYSEELKSRQTSSERTTVVDGREVTIRGDTVWLACFKSITTPLGEFSRSSHRVYFTHITQTTTVGPPTPSAAETVCASRSVSMSAPPTLPHEETQPTKVICSASPEKSTRFVVDLQGSSHKDGFPWGHFPWKWAHEFESLPLCEEASVGENEEEDVGLEEWMTAPDETGGDCVSLASLSNRANAFENIFVSIYVCVCVWGGRILLCVIIATLF